MNMGVWTDPCANANSPARAADSESLALIEKVPIILLNLIQLWRAKYTQ
jgi:hypothetical protein